MIFAETIEDLICAIIGAIFGAFIVCCCVLAKESDERGDKDERK